MASNLRTPRSVLTAPKRTWVFLHQTKGPNRAERRHGSTGWGFVDKDGNKHQDLYGAKAQGAFKGREQVKGHLNRQDFALRYPTDNEPYVDISPKVENKSKWRRWAKRFRT